MSLSGWGIAWRLSWSKPSSYRRWSCRTESQRRWGRTVSLDQQRVGLSLYITEMTFSHPEKVVSFNVSVCCVSSYWICGCVCTADETFTVEEAVEKIGFGRFHVLLFLIMGSTGVRTHKWLHEWDDTVFLSFRMVCVWVCVLVRVCRLLRPWRSCC